MSLHLAARLGIYIPVLARTTQIRSLSKQIPPPRENFKTPNDFLSAIGRSCETKLKVESWDELWKLDGLTMKKKGLAVQDRRYILWAMEKFRHGENPHDFSHPEKPKKKVRGWGPAVQNGVRIRSRRKR